jgi:histidyl-tRNA synthetase
MNKIPLPAGFDDISGDYLEKWRFMEAGAAILFERFGFSELRTPLLEQTDLFVRGIGEATDIVEKEMYSFGQGGDSVSLRPEGTASVIRSYIENGLDKFDSFQKIWYLGPMFRHEKPQKGRKRQFHQAGVEVLGSKEPCADAEVIILGVRLLNILRVQRFNLALNSTGCPACKDNYRMILEKELRPRLDGLCDNCRRRYRTNIFRVLDCKQEGCRQTLEGVPFILETLCSPCREHHEAVKQYLIDLDIEFEEEPYLVRGLDYYTRTVFELTHGGLGAQNALIGGGRYDNLVEEMGGKPQQAVGFAAGLERIAEVMEPLQKEKPRQGIYIAAIGKQAADRAFTLAHELRNNGIKADVDFEQRSLKSQMKTADRRLFRIAAILGEDELAKGMITFRDLGDGTQAELPLDDVAGSIPKLLKEIDESFEHEIQDS